MRWFVAQHGKRNGCIQHDHILHEGVKWGDACRAELERRKLWDEKQQSALYAWNASAAQGKEGVE